MRCTRRAVAVNENESCARGLFCAEVEDVDVAALPDEVIYGANETGMILRSLK